jgi:hypothetical protein
LLYRVALLTQLANSGKLPPEMKRLLREQAHYVREVVVKLDPSYAEQFRQRKS